MNHLLKIFAIVSIIAFSSCSQTASGDPVEPEQESSGRKATTPHEGELDSIRQELDKDITYYDTNFVEEADTNFDDFSAFLDSILQELDKNIATDQESNQNILVEEGIFNAVSQMGRYTTRDSVAAYLCKFERLPDNYMGKNDAIAIYESQGNIFTKWNFNPWNSLGVMVGGDAFGNREQLLPAGSYREADVDYNGNNRGTKRLVYESNCNIYYTADHYGSFVKLEFYE